MNDVQQVVRSFLDKFLPSKWIDLTAQNASRGDDWLGISQRRGTSITVSRTGERRRCPVEQVVVGDVVFDNVSGMPYLVRSIKLVHR